MSDIACAALTAAFAARGNIKVIMTVRLRVLSTIQPDQFVAFCDDAAKSGRTWEKTAIAKLFKLLGCAYDIAVYMTGANKSEVASFHDLLLRHDIKVQKNSRLDALAARLVFGTDRKRCFVYAKAIARAKKQGIKADEFVTWLSDQGGIEEAAQTSQRSNKGAVDAQVKLASNAALDARALSSVTNFDAAKLHVNSTNIGVAIIRKTGAQSFDIVFCCSDDSAIRHALASQGKLLEKEGICKGSGAGGAQNQIPDQRSAPAWGFAVCCG